MDEFAQSREDDDLFADDFEPVFEPTAVIEEVPPTITPQNEVQVNSNNRREQGPERRGRGSRGGFSGRGHNGLSSSRYATPSDSVPAQATNANTNSTTENATSQNPLPSDNAHPASETPAATRTPAVRGDRSATGGPAHKKLTEEELTAKMKKMEILNAEKAERHRLSEADQAAYQNREKELAKERREKAVAEKKNERVMEMERAKNRERKMKAQGGREWDSEKVESNIVDRRGRGRSSEYVRGGHGGVIRDRGGLSESRFSGLDDTNESDMSQSRGRGGFQARGKGGRGGRGGRGGKASTPVAPTAEDFPSLPTAKAPATSGDEVKAEPVKSPMGDKTAGDWAEEMATPMEEKKMTI